MSETSPEMREKITSTATSESNNFLRTFGETATSGANFKMNLDADSLNKGLVLGLEKTTPNASVPVLDGD